MDAIHLEGFAQINSARIAARPNADVKFEITFCNGRIVFEPIVRLVDLNHSAPLFVRRQTGDRLGSIFQRAAHAMGRAIGFLRLERGEEQGDVAGCVGGGHRGAVHLRVAAQQPVRHGSDRAAGGGEVHAEVAIERGPARAPGVLHVLARGAHAVLIEHHLRRDTRANAEQRAGAAAGRTDGGKCRAVIARAGAKDDAVAVYDVGVFRINSADIRA